MLQLNSFSLPERSGKRSFSDYPDLRQQVPGSALLGDSKQAGKARIWGVTTTTPHIVTWDMGQNPKRYIKTASKRLTYTKPQSTIKASGRGIKMSDKTRININVSNELLQRIDKEAKRLGTTRSSLITSWIGEKMALVEQGQVLAVDIVKKFFDSPELKETINAAIKKNGFKEKEV